MAFHLNAYVRRRAIERNTPYQFSVGWRTALRYCICSPALDANGMGSEVHRTRRAASTNRGSRGKLLGHADLTSNYGIRERVAEAVGARWPLAVGGR